MDEFNVTAGEDGTKGPAGDAGLDGFDAVVTEENCQCLDNITHTPINVKGS